MSGSRVRFWPSLYDRLLKGEAHDIDLQFIDTQTLEETVRRDLATLLGTTPLETYDDLSQHDRVRKSVLNYGAADLHGRVVAGISEWRLQERYREALEWYEPRIDVYDVKVWTEEASSLSDPEDDVRIDSDHGVRLAISGRIYGTPEDDIWINTHLDIESGTSEIEIE